MCQRKVSAVRQQHTECEGGATQNRHGAAVSLHLERVRKPPPATIPYERIKLSISDWAQVMESSIDSFR